MAMSIVDYIATEYHDVDDVERLKKMISICIDTISEIENALDGNEVIYIRWILRRGYKPYRENFEKYMKE